MRFWGHGDRASWEDDPEPIVDMWETAVTILTFLLCLLFSTAEIVGSMAGEDTGFAFLVALLSFALLVRSHTSYMHVLNTRGRYYIRDQRLQVERQAETGIRQAEAAARHVTDPEENVLSPQCVTHYKHGYAVAAAMLDMAGSRFFRVRSYHRDIPYAEELYLDDDSYKALYYLLRMEMKGEIGFPEHRDGTQIQPNPEHTELPKRRAIRVRKRNGQAEET